MEILKQPLCAPLSTMDQVLMLIIATNKLLLDVEPSKIKSFITDLVEFIKEKHPEIEETINKEQTVNESIISRVVKATKEYKGGLKND